MSGQRLTDSRYKTLAEAAFEGVAFVDKTRIVDANDQLAHALRYDSRDELIGEDISVFLPAEDVEAVRRQIQRSVDTGVATLEQQRCICKDGSEIIAELRGKVLHEHNTDTSILVLRDVTEWKRAERELEQAYADLEQFTHIASHDLRTPLRALGNLSQWIIEDLGDDIPQQSAKHLRLIRERVERMDQLLNDLLRYAQASGRDTKLQMVDLAELLGEAVDSLDVPEGMTVEFDDELPTFETAWAPLKQVFVNLIGNALGHHDRDEGRVTISARPAGGFFEFTVADDGPGIEERYHQKIFEIFQTLQTRNDSDGSGMGLSLAKRIVESAGGSIEVHSKPSQQRGTTFRFTWPQHWHAGT